MPSSAVAMATKYFLRNYMFYSLNFIKKHPVHAKMCQYILPLWLIQTSQFSNAIFTSYRWWLPWQHKKLPQNWGFITYFYRVWFLGCNFFDFGGPEHKHTLCHFFCNDAFSRYHGNQPFSLKEHAFFIIYHQKMQLP